MVSGLCHCKAEMQDYLCDQVVREIVTLIGSINIECLRMQTWVYDPYAGFCWKGEISSAPSSALMELRSDLFHTPASSTHHRILSCPLLFVGDALRPGILSVAMKIDLRTTGIWHGSVQYDPVMEALASSMETWNAWPSCQLLEKFLKEAEYCNKKTIPNDGDKSGFMTSFESSRWFYDAKARSVPALSGSMDLTSMLALFKWIWLGSVVLVIEMFPLMYVIWLITSFPSP